MNNSALANTPANDDEVSHTQLHPEALLDIQRDAAMRNAVIDAALDCIIMMDAHGYVVEFNRAAERTFGYTHEEAIGAKLADLVVPSHLRCAHQKGLERYLKTGAHNVLNKRVEVPSINKSGDELLVELAIAPVEYGDTVFFCAYLRDITEARAAQNRLRASEERFQSLFELSPDAILVIDESGHVVDANSQACELAGHGKTEMLGRHAMEFMSKAEHEKAVSLMAELRAGNTVRFEFDFLNADGYHVPTEVVGRRIDTETGPLYHGVIRNVSQRMIAEQQLRDARDVAEQASAAKSDFLANMSHEMRTPLNGVIGSLSLIDRDALGNEPAGLINTAKRSAETLLTLIDDLLDLSRIEAGEMDIEVSSFDPGELSSIVAELFGPLADRKGVSLISRMSVAHRHMRGDIGKIRQVLVNLVGNALKFTQRGHVEVVIDYVGDAISGELRFKVSDTGIGISTEDQRKLFDRFKQADSSRSRSHNGAGLGLSICKELIEVMDGTITLESEPGVGSTFGFNVPVQTRSAEPCETDRQAVAGSQLSGHVLIAEDSETNAMVAKKMLDKFGLTYRHVVDGAAAIDAAIEEPFDLVLMDVSMPILDGLKATRILRERGYETPILAMTAHALKGDRDQAIEAGMSGYITKPVQPDALRRSVGEWLATPTIEERTDNMTPRVETNGLDHEAISEIWSDDLETYAEIAKIFLSELDWRLPGLKDTTAPDLEHQAHSLKGAASNVGASELSRLAANLERMSADGKSQGIETLVDAIHAEAATVRTSLETDYIETYAHG